MPIRKYYYRGGTGGAQGRWKHPKSTGLQIGSTTIGGGGNAPTPAYQQILTAIPPDMAKGITGSAPMTLLNSYEAGRRSLAKASEGDINKVLLEQKIIDQPVTIEGGETQTLALNPYNEKVWDPTNYATRNATIKYLKEKDPEQDKYLRSFESAWTEETPVTTPTDKLTIA